MGNIGDGMDEQSILISVISLSLLLLGRVRCRLSPMILALVVQERKKRKKKKTKKGWGIQIKTLHSDYVMGCL